MTMPQSAVRLIRWQNEHHWVTDCLVAAVIFIVDLTGHTLVSGSIAALLSNPWSASGAALCLLCSAAVAVRRRWPLVAWVGCAVVPPLWEVAVRSTALHDVQPVVPSTAMVAGTPFVLAVIARRYPMRWTVAALLVSLGLAGLAAHSSQQLRNGALPLVLLISALIYIVGILVGILNRIQSEQLAELETRSERLALAREQAALLAAANERSRIAREMHDVVAHSLAVMITMADGAAATVDRNPAMAKEALGVLAEAGRSALADTRRLVGVLRDDPNASSAPAPPNDGPFAPRSSGAPPVKPTGGRATPVVRELPVPEFAPPGTVAPVEPSRQIEDLRRQATDHTADTSTGETPLAPAPEQADLEVLVERFKAAGIPITYEWRGQSLPEDKGLQLTVFRIAQEALTNVLRYAPTTRAVAVSMDRHAGTAVLTVDNDAAPGSTPMHGSGKGLLGMRERAAVYGGTVQAGPTASGWRVRAVLRWDEDEEGTSPWQMPQ